MGVAKERREETEGEVVMGGDKGKRGVFFCFWFFFSTFLVVAMPAAGRSLKNKETFQGR